jgi:hypothetical protein
MTRYFSQTDSIILPLDENSTSKDFGNSKNEYKFNQNGVAFQDLSPEEEISKEDEIKFYKKVFETKSI